MCFITSAKFLRGNGVGNSCKVQNQQFNKSVFNLNQAFDALATDHYAVIPQFLTSTMREALLAELLAVASARFISWCDVGRGALDKLVQAHIRGDSICWLEDHFTYRWTVSGTDGTASATIKCRFYLVYALWGTLCPLSGWQCLSTPCR